MCFSTLTMAFRPHRDIHSCPLEEQRWVGKDEIDLVLDTASIPNILRPKDGVLLSRITDDRVSLDGVGNSVVVSESSGYSVFGKTLIMNQGHNLVSQYQIKDRYKIVEITGDCFLLGPR